MSILTSGNQRPLGPRLQHQWLRVKSPREFFEAPNADGEPEQVLQSLRHAHLIARAQELLTSDAVFETM